MTKCPDCGEYWTAQCPNCFAKGKASVVSSALLARAVELLKMAKCPECDGSGAIPVRMGEHFVTHEMALDAGEPAMEGQSMGVEWGAQQCQWCDEKNQLLAEYEARANAPAHPRRAK